MRNWISYASSSNWLRVVGVATIVLIAAYAMVQQTIRLSANDAPLAAAQTAKHQLEDGARPADVIPTVKTDLKTDNTVFITITNQDKTVLASSAQLDGAPNLPPAGTFTDTHSKGSNWFTWQPESGVRQAVEMLSYSSGNTNGFIIAGQSLTPFENRVNHIGWITLAGWVAVVLWATFIPVPSLHNKK